MKKFTEVILKNRRTVLVIWTLALLAGGFFSIRLQGALQGSSDIIRNSPSDKVTQIMNAKFGKGSAYPFLVVIDSPSVPVDDPRFAAAALSVEQELLRDRKIRQVRSFWNTGTPELIGNDRKSALLLVIPFAEDFSEAENLTAEIRERVHGAQVGPDFTLKVTGTVAMFHDLNRNSSSDLLSAERIGIPLTLVILLIVFGTPLAASLPLLLAMASVTLSLAGLYFLSHWVPINVFTQNMVSMIGLGVGVDYALFILSRFRRELRHGMKPIEATLQTATAVGHAVLFSGITVAVGFLALFMVKAQFLHTLALGGIMVVTVSLAATFSLLPVILSYSGELVNWPRMNLRRSTDNTTMGKMWGIWARSIMRRPLLYVLPAIAALLIFLVPVFRLQAWNAGAMDLDEHTEARQGFELLKKNYEKGWMGPVVVLIQSGSNLWSRGSQDAVLAMASRLGADERVARVLGYPAILNGLGPFRHNVKSGKDLPSALQPTTRDAISEDGKTALMVLLTKEPPESLAVQQLVSELREGNWEEAESAGLEVKAGGATAMVSDFDKEMFRSLWRVVPAVLVLTFAALMFLFRSLLIPIKATVLNLLSVLASYGFLVYIFQEGIGAGFTGLTPPGGLNSFVVLMLFTVLFGLSMDYEVFLLSQIKEEYEKCGDNTYSVAEGLKKTGGIITAAALIMVTLFGSFAFTKLTATREFGLGLAFAVLLDASLIRIVLVPALMELFGSANWWFPTGLKRLASMKSIR